MTNVSSPTTADSSGRSVRLARATRVADYSVMVLAVLLGGGSIVLFAWSGRPSLVNMRMSPGSVLAWNAFLSLVFFAQHSVMVRRSVRSRLAAAIPRRYDGAFYAITSGIVLTLVVLLYQRVEAPPLFTLHGLARVMISAAAVLAFTVIIWAVLALRTFDPCGVRPIRQHLRGGLDIGSSDNLFRAKAFVVRGPFRWVRHPLYSAIIVLLWATPQMTVTRLELAVLWTTWIYVGALLEERDLITEFGEKYRQYCRQVPMLIPWRGRITTQPEHSPRF